MTTGSTPNWVTGYVPTAFEWNHWWSIKYDDTSDLTDASLTTTGTTTLRQLGDRFADWLNVKDFGAKLDGVASDTAAFNAARAAAINGQTIYVPPGKLNIGALTADTTKQVRWMLDGVTFPSGGNIPTMGPTNSGDLTESFFINGGTKYLGKRTNPAAASYLLRMDYILDGVPGSNQYIGNPLTINSVINAGVLNALWGICVVGDNYATDPTNGGLTGIQSTVRKHGAGFVQAIQVVALDDTHLPSSSGRGFTAIELAQRANNIDDAPNAAMYGGVGNRIAMHVSQTLQDTTLTGETNFSYGIWASTDATGHIYTKSVYGVAMNTATYQVFDARGAIAPYVSTDPVASLRMLAGQIVDFNGGPKLNSPPGNYLQYFTTTGTKRLRYMVGATEQWSIDDTGTMTLAGTAITGFGTGIGQVPVFQNYQSSGFASLGFPSRLIIYKSGATTDTDFATMQVHRATTHTGGVATNIVTNFRATVTVGAAVKESEWAILGQTTTSSNVGGQAVGGDFQGVRLTGSNSAIWGGIFNAIDQTNNASSVSAGGITAGEIDVRASGADDGLNGTKFGGKGLRQGLQFVIVRQSTTVDLEVSHGIWFCANEPTNAKYSSAIGFAIGTQTYSALDTRGAVAPTGYTDAVAAVRMSAGQIIDFKGGTALNSAAGNYLQYFNTSGTARLRYMVGATERLSIDDLGNVAVSGNISVTGTLNAAGGSFLTQSQRGAPNGVASLDATGLVPVAQLPVTATTGTLKYRGAWNPVTNTPTLANNGVGGIANDYFVASIAGTSPSIDGLTTWQAGDWIINSGTVWQRLQLSSVLYLPLSGGALSGPLTTAGGAIFQAADSRLSPFVAYSWSDAAGNIGPFIDATGAMQLSDAAVRTNLLLNYTPTLAAHAVRKDYVDNNFIGPTGGTVPSLTLTGAITQPQQAVTKQYVDASAASGGAGGLQGLTSQKDFPYPPLRDPKRDYGAIGNGVTDDSVKINACVAAALAAGERCIAINDTYNCPNLDWSVAQVLMIGVGQLVNANIQMFVIPPFAPSAPPVLNSTTLYLNSHCPKFAAKLRAQKPTDPPAVVVITGESTYAPATSATILPIFWARARLAMQDANPGKNISVINRAVGGQRWSNLDSTVNFGDPNAEPTIGWYTTATRAWLEYIHDLNPDVVMIGFSGNDGNAFRIQYMISVLNKMAAWAKPPEIILATSNPYAQQYQTNQNTALPWEGQQAVAAIERSWAISKGLGLVDTSRAVTIHCKGFDPEDIPLKRDFAVTGGQVNARKAIALPFTWPTRCWGWSGAFYINVNSWAALGNELQFELGTHAQGAPNAGCILRVGRDTSSGQIYYEVDTCLVSYGAPQNSVHISKTFAPNWLNPAAGNMSFMVSVSGSKLVLQTLKGSGTDGIDQWTFGLITSIPRYNQPWQPKITCTVGAVSNALWFEKDAFGYAYAASGTPDQRAFYMPSMTEHEAYGSRNSDPDWSGGGVGHDSALKGVWAIQAAINSCVWGA